MNTGYSFFVCLKISFILLYVSGYNTLWSVSYFSGIVIPFFSKICFKCVFMRIPDTILALQYFVTIFAICSIVSLSLFMPSITGL